jgi:hypothetical protein
MPLGRWRLSLRNSRKEKTTSPFNFLKALDERVLGGVPEPTGVGEGRARTWERAINWSKYGPFIFARYPHLKPRPLPDNASAKSNCEKQQQIWEECRLEITNHSETAACVQRLNARQQTELAALLIEIHEAFENREHQNSNVALRRHLANEAPQRNRRLNHKLAAVCKALQKLKEYASDSRRPEDETLHTARQILGHDHLCAASHALAVLEALKSGNDGADFYESLRHEYSTAERAEAFGMVQLYWFFKHECGLSENESEVRVARLRNAFWTKFGIKKVPYCQKKVTESDRGTVLHSAPGKGCSAVHLAVRRFRLS